MQEIVGDLFESELADAICITTNGFVNAQGAVTMGRGCAYEAKYRWPGVQMLLGNLIQQGGHRVHLLTSEQVIDGKPQVLLSLRKVPYHVVAFPTKHHWREDSDLELITKSAVELDDLATSMGWKSVILPRPGCGLGRLSWEDQVRPLLERLLDDRFYVISP